MPTTSGGLRYPASSDVVNVPGDIQNLADDVDTTKATKASPALTGTPTAPTAAADTNTTQIATTAFVLGQGNSTAATIAMDGVQAAGSSNLYARADHVHPTDTSRAASAHTHDSSQVPTVVLSTQSGSYTLVLTDAGKTILMNSASAQTLTVPTNASVAFPVGTKIDVLQTGAGETTIAGAGVTINSEGSKLKLNAQWAAATLIKRGTDTWVVIGSLKA